MMAAAIASGSDLPRVVDGGWFDAAGSEIVLRKQAFAWTPIVPGDRPLADLVTLFDAACLRVEIGSAAALPAIEARRDWGFSYLDADAGTTPGARLDGWQASDVTLTSQPAAWPLAECNLLAARSTADTVDAVAALLTARLGTPPARTTAARVDNKAAGTLLRWDVAGPTGAPRRIYASLTIRSGVRYLHLGVTEPRRAVRG